MSQRRPSGPATSRPGSRRTSAGRLVGRSLRTALVGVLAGAVLVGGALPAGAAPRNPTDGEIGAAQSEQEKAAAEVGRIAALVAGAEAELERVGVQAEAAGTAYLAAEEALLAAQAAAEQTAAELRDAADSRRRRPGPHRRVLARQLHERQQPQRVRRIARLRGPRRADPAGRPARLRRRQPARRPRPARGGPGAPGQRRLRRPPGPRRDGRRRGVRALGQAGRRRPAGRSSRAPTSRSRRRRRITTGSCRRPRSGCSNCRVRATPTSSGSPRSRPRRPPPRRRPSALPARPPLPPRRPPGGTTPTGVAGGAPPSNSNYVFPTSGHVSSCYGWRWGALHGGVDIAAPIGTNIYAATSGIVARNRLRQRFRPRALHPRRRRRGDRVRAREPGVRLRRHAGARRPADRRGGQPGQLHRPAPALRGALRAARCTAARSTRCRGCNARGVYVGGC